MPNTRITNAIKALKNLNAADLTLLTPTERGELFDVLKALESAAAPTIIDTLNTTPLKDICPAPFYWRGAAVDLTIFGRWPIILEARKNGQKIAAIKSIRDWTGLGLGDAKDLVEKKLGFGA